VRLERTANLNLELQSCEDIERLNQLERKALDELRAESWCRFSSPVSRLLTHGLLVKEESGRRGRMWLRLWRAAWLIRFVLVVFVDVMRWEDDS